MIIERICHGNPHVPHEDAGEYLVMFRNKIIDPKPGYTVEVLLDSDEYRDAYKTYIEMLSLGKYEEAQRVMDNLPVKFIKCKYGHGMGRATYCRNFPTGRYQVKEKGAGLLAKCPYAEQ